MRAIMINDHTTVVVVVKKKRKKMKKTQPLIPSFLVLLLSLSSFQICAFTVNPVVSSYPYLSRGVVVVINRPTDASRKKQHIVTLPKRQRKSLANVHCQGLFGLGAPEIAIIVVAAAIALGPQKLASFGRDAGKLAAELKEVPQEFKKGLTEGEIEAKSKKAKSMEMPLDEISDSQNMNKK